MIAHRMSPSAFDPVCAVRSTQAISGKVMYPTQQQFPLMTYEFYTTYV